VVSSWILFFIYQDDARSNTHQIEMFCLLAGDVDHLLLDDAELNRCISQTELLCVLCSEPCGIVTGNGNGSVTETVLSTAYIFWCRSSVSCMLIGELLVAVKTE